MESTATADRVRSEQRGGLALAATLSVAVHLLVAGSLGASWLSSGVAARATVNRPDQSPDTELGIERSDAVTMTWLGFQERKPMAAPKSEVDQAALSMDPAGVPEPAAEPVPRATSEPVSTPEPVEDPAPRPAPAMAEAPEAIQGPADIPMPSETPVQDPSPTEKPAEQPSQQPAEKPAEQPTQPQTKPKPAQQPDEGLRGESSDRDSPAAATEPELVYEQGKPLAREGMEVLPKWFPIWRTVLLSNNPRNPLVRFSFDRNGKAKLVEFVVENDVLQNTGSDEFDQVLLNGLYQWTAKGKAIDVLEEGQTASVRIRMKLR